MKKKIANFLSLALLVSFVQFASAQNDAKELIIDQITAFVENSDGEGDFDFNTLYEDYLFYESNPLNLNKATRAQLEEIPFLSQKQILELLDHRKKYGKLKTIYELQTIPSFNLETIRLIRNMVKVPISLSQIQDELKVKENWKQVLFVKWKRGIETQNGFTRSDSSGYLGSPDHLYLRYRLNVGRKIQAGLLAEKDAGEPYYYPKKIYGADYYSAHVAIKELTSFIPYFVVGDFMASFGQGLILHSGFGVGKSALTTKVRKGGPRLRPYSSVSEFNYLRGAGVSMQLYKAIELTAFSSYKNREGTLRVDDDDPFGGPYISSLSEAGYHRTLSEIEKKNSSAQWSNGASLRFLMKRGHIAVNGLHERLKIPLQAPPSDLYKYYQIKGKHLFNGSVDYGYYWNNFNFFGETAIAHNFAIANVHGVLMTLDPKFDLSLVYRNYAKDYNTLNANAFGESPNATNEAGIYTGLEYRPAKGWVINAYADLWKHHWVKYLLNGLTNGEEYFVRVRYFKKRKWSMYAQYFYENKYKNRPGYVVVNYPVLQNKQRLRVHGSIKLTKALELRNRVEFSRFEDIEKPVYGFMLYQDILFKPIGSNFQFTSRLGIFDIEDYDARIYAYENDIINEYYIPAYNGQGIRFYLNARWRINNHIRIEGRYDITHYNALNNKPIEPRHNDIGSGLTAIEGNTRSIVKFQIRYKW